MCTQWKAGSQGGPRLLNTPSKLLSTNTVRILSVENLLPQPPPHRTNILYTGEKLGNEMEVGGHTGSFLDSEM